MKEIFRKSANIRRENLSLGLIVFFLYFFFALILVFKYGYVSPEAVIRRGIAFDLVHGKIAGCQGAVCSIWWTPLPTLLQIPFLLISQTWAETIGSIFFSCLAAAFSLVFMSRILCYFGVEKIFRRLLLLLFFLHPYFAFSVIGGDTMSMYLLGWIAFIYFSLRWSHRFEVKYLLYLSLSMGAGVLILHQGIFYLVITSFLILSVLHTQKKAARAEKEGTLLTYLTPGFYVMAVWALFNWLIMGNMFYFLRGTYINPSFVQDISSGGPLVKPPFWQNCLFLLKYEFLHFPLLFIGAAALVFSLFRFKGLRKNKDSAWLLLLTVPPFLCLLFMYSRSQMINLFTESLVYLPLSFIFMGKLISFLKEQKRILPVFIVIIVFLFLLFPMFLEGRYKDSEEAKRAFHNGSTYRVLNHLTGKANGETEQLIQMVRILEQSGESDRKILLCGFKGYQVLKYSRQKSLYIHTMDLHMEKI